MAANLPGSLTTYALDTGLLPESTQGKLRLWVTDGLNNSESIFERRFQRARSCPAGEHPITD